MRGQRTDLPPERINKIYLCFLPDDEAWLRKEAHRRRTSMSEVIRSMIGEARCRTIPSTIHSTTHPTRLESSASR